VQPGSHGWADAVPGVLPGRGQRGSGTLRVVAEGGDERHVPEDGGGQGVVAGLPGGREGDVEAAVGNGGLAEVEEGEACGQQRGLGQCGGERRPGSAVDAVYEADAELGVGVGGLVQGSCGAGPVELALAARDLRDLQSGQSGWPRLDGTLDAGAAGRRNRRLGGVRPRGTDHPGALHDHLYGRRGAHPPPHSALAARCHLRRCCRPRRLLPSRLSCSPSPSLAAQAQATRV
jgi:hypothetical protein